jgi:hypothetical protein
LAVHADEEQARGAFALEDIVSDCKDAKHSKPFVEGEHLERWLPADQKWLEWGTKRAPALFSRPTFPEIYTVSEKLISVDMSAGVQKLRVAYDDQQLLHNHSAWSFVPWHALEGVRNNSLKKAARYRGEKSRPDLPKREELEKTSRRFSVKFLLGVMNSGAARDFLRANRRSNIHLYPDDWKKLPIPDVPPAQQQPIVALVDQILAAKRANPNANISALEAALDTQINALYGITSLVVALARAMPTVVTTARTEAGMKELLRDKVIPQLAAATPYFSLQAIRAALDAARCQLESELLTGYLHALTEAHFIYDAGRGWYSRLATPFTLNQEPVSTLVQELKKKFPLVEFSCWSTEQIKEAMHHLLSRFVTFVNVEADAMESVWEHLREVGWDAWLNPRGAEAARFAVRERTVVVRRESRKSPSKDPFAPIEKLLVELCFESRDLQFMALAEFHTALANIAGTQRIQMATMLKYANERKLPPDLLFGANNQLTPPFQKRRL